MEQLIKPEQNRRLHAILSKLEMIEQKADIILSYSNGRTAHSTEVTPIEANEAIKDFQEKMNFEDDEMLDKQRKNLVSKMIEMEAVNHYNRADMPFIYEFIRLYFRKELNKMNKSELQKTIAVLETKWLPWYYAQKAKFPGFNIKLYVSLKNNLS